MREKVRFILNKTFYYKKLLTSLEINNKGMKNRRVINNAGTYLFSFYLRDLQTIFLAQFANFLSYYLEKLSPELPIGCFKTTK